MTYDHVPALVAALAAAVLVSAPAALAQDAQPAPNVEEIPDLGPGEFRWFPERSESGPVVMLVSLPDQLGFVYRNGIRIGVTTVSTGRPGHVTPTGVFHVLEKQKQHYSSIYKGAAMPNMERLSWTGIALHAGDLPGYPASHGCVRMPLEFSKLLFGVTDKGTTVVISDGGFGVEHVAHPGLVIPTAVDYEETGLPTIEPTGGRFWRPELAPEGPVSVLISSADQAVLVFRNGIPIGRSPIEIADPERPLPWGISIMLEGHSDQPDPWVPGRMMPRWMSVDLPDGETEAQFEHEVLERVGLSSDFAVLVMNALEPGASLVVTNRPATDETHSATDFTVMTHDEPAEVTAAREG